MITFDEYLLRNKIANPGFPKYFINLIVFIIYKAKSLYPFTIIKVILLFILSCFNYGESFITFVSIK